MTLRVSVAAGSGFEVLVRAAAVADPRWREVFATGRIAHRQLRSAAGPAFLREVASLGRFGWINLAPLLASCRAPWSLDRLRGAVEASDSADLHVALLGGRRRQLIAAVGSDGVRQALAGERAARARLRRALASDDNVVSATPWLMRTPSVEVCATVRRVLAGWPELPMSPSVEETVLLRGQVRTAKARLAARGGRRLLGEVAPGVSYDPPGMDRLVLVASPSVRPVLLVVDDIDRTVVVHPAYAAPVETAADLPAEEPSLVQLARAVGDETRMALLAELRAGSRTAMELVEAMGAPRTTLLHHLAMLRAAGLVRLSVTPGATVYALRGEGFHALAAAAKAFPHGSNR